MLSVPFLPIDFHPHFSYHEIIKILSFLKVKEEYVMRQSLCFKEHLLSKSPNLSYFCGKLLLKTKFCYPIISWLEKCGWKSIGRNGPDNIQVELGEGFSDGQTPGWE